MPNSTRDIKRRLKSIKNTYKVTKAMEMVSAAKMRKAQDQVLTSREYAQDSWHILLQFKKQAKDKVALLAKPKKGKTKLLLIIAPDKGLCGGLNSKLLLEIGKIVEKITVKPKVISLGLKAGLMARKLDLEVLGHFEKLSTPPSLLEVLPVADFIFKEYLTDYYSEVLLVYTDFKSTVKQNPLVKQLLPLKKQRDLGEVGKKIGPVKQVDLSSFKFEPSVEAVVEQMAQRILETQIYQAVLEASASEHSARMLAMKNASDNAEEILSDLTLSYNSARQASITQELAEISASRL